MTFEDRLIDVAGGRVFVRDWPAAVDAQRPPLALLHDSLGSVELWRDFPAALAAATGRRVIAWDRLGFGRSSPRHGTPSPRFIDEEAQQHAPAVLRALGVEQFSLFGHSVGGAMALVTAARAGAACRGVITESAQSFIEERTRDVAGVSPADRRRRRGSGTNGADQPVRPRAAPRAPRRGRPPSGRLPCDDRSGGQLIGPTLEPAWRPAHDAPRYAAEPLGRLAAVSVERKRNHRTLWP